ncbi:unnamed protein product [Symbiodinium sp. CCMP2456]|nr:unnamed protein product [Symbiodinium sp. CCMP2456]
MDAHRALRGGYKALRNQPTLASNDVAQALIMSASGTLLIFAALGISVGAIVAMPGVLLGAGMQVPRPIHGHDLVSPPWTGYRQAWHDWNQQTLKCMRALCSYMAFAARRDMAVHNILLMCWFTQQPFRDRVFWKGPGIDMEPPHDLDREASVESEGEAPHVPREGSPPRGPPPPLPIQALQVPSQTASVALCDALGLSCPAVTHLPWNWNELEAVTIHVRPMPASDRFHPNLIHCGESADEVPSSASGSGTTMERRTNRSLRPARATREEMDRAMTDQDWNAILEELNLHDARDLELPDNEEDERSAWEITSRTLSSATAQPVLWPARRSTTMETTGRPKPKAKPRALRKCEAYLIEPRRGRDTEE